MSNLRIFGIIAGLFGLILTFRTFRGPQWKRLNFIIYGLLSSFLLIISLDPDILNVLNDILSFKEGQRGRLFTLIIFSIFVIYYFIYYFKIRLDFMKYQFDRLVRNVSKKFETELKDNKKKKFKKIMILIPAYNEKENLQELIKRIPVRIGIHEIGCLIINDGSNDGTDQLKSGANVILYNNIINRGGGAALRLGYDILMDNAVKICVTMDADNQHDPGEISKLIKPILDKKADIVIGSRILGKNLSKGLFRKLGVVLFNSIISFLLKHKVTDCSSGFRAFNMDLINKIDLKEDQYHTSELIIEAIKKGYKINEVPIVIYARKYGETKKGKDINYGFNFAKVILKTWWRK